MMRKKISPISLIILIVAAIDNMRNLPAAALFGSSLIFFFAFSAVAFLIPTSLMAAELASAFPEHGGIYHWVHRAFGKHWAMAAIWLQWINTIVWYPTMLSFIAGILAYLINPALVENKVYLLTCALTIFWSLTYINTKGFHVSIFINNICTILGTVLPLLLFLLLGAIWLFNGHPLQIDFRTSDLLPSLSQSSDWISLVAIMASFLGMELAGVHVNDIQKPQKNFPRAVFISCIFIFISMAFGSMIIALVLPNQEISLVAGIMQVFSNFFNVFRLSLLTPILAILIVVGSLGTMINWLVSPAKGLLHAAEFGFLPPCFARVNRAGVASNILIGQAILVTIICCFFIFEPTVNAFYWFLTALSTELYMLMYILMFCAGLRLHYTHPTRPNAFKIPGNRWGIWLISSLGLSGCIATVSASFFPPEQVDIGTPLGYLCTILLGNVLTITPLFLFYFYRKQRAKFHE